MSDLEQLIRDIVRDELAKVEPSTADGLLTVREAADYARCSTSAIRAWLRVGKLDELRVGVAIRVRRSDVDHAMTTKRRPSREVAPTSTDAAIRKLAAGIR